MNALFKKEMPKLIRGLKFVHKKFKKNFDMAVFSSDDKQPKLTHKCKTAACAIGWKNTFIPDSPLKCVIKRTKSLSFYRKFDYDFVPKFGHLYNFYAIEKAYDLNEKEAAYLFGPNSLSALEVAHRIESVLFDGFPVDLD